MSKVTVEPGAEKYLQEKGMTRWDWVGFGIGMASNGFNQYRKISADGVITPREIAESLGVIADELEAMFGADVEIKVTKPG